MPQIIQLHAGRYTGNAREVANLDRIPRGWIPWPAQPQPGAVWRGPHIGFDAPPPAPDRSAEIEAARQGALYQAAKAHESASCDGNKVSLITTIEAICLATQRAPPPKSAAARAWLDALWADWHQRGESGATDIDFSMHGTCPYSYAEIRTEAMG